MKKQMKSPTIIGKVLIFWSFLGLFFFGLASIAGWIYAKSTEETYDYKCNYMAKSMLIEYTPNGVVATSSRPEYLKCVSWDNAQSNTFIVASGNN